MQLKQQLFEEAEDLSTFLVSMAKVSGFASSFSSSLSLHLFCPLQVTLNHGLSVNILKFNESENYLMTVFLASFFTFISLSVHQFLFLHSNVCNISCVSVSTVVLSEVSFHFCHHLRLIYFIIYILYPNMGSKNSWYCMLYGFFSTF